MVVSDFFVTCPVPLPAIALQHNCLATSASTVPVWPCHPETGFKGKATEESSTGVRRSWFVVVAGERRFQCTGNGYAWVAVCR